MTTTIDIDQTKPLYVISDSTIDENTLRDAVNKGYKYYSWLQVYSRAYKNDKREEKVNMVTVKVEGINANGRLWLRPDKTYTFDAFAAREKWKRLIRDFGWKVYSFKDKSFYHQMLPDIGSLQYTLYDEMHRQ